MRYLIFSLLIFTAVPVCAQTAQDELSPGLYIVFAECDSCPALRVDLDTLKMRPSLRRWIDSLAKVYGWGNASGRTYINGAWPIDSAGALYSLNGYMADDYTAVDGSVTLSGLTTDSQRVNLSSGLTHVTGLTGRVVSIQYFVYAAGYGVKTTTMYKAPPIGVDSTIQFHITRRGGSWYFGVYYVSMTASGPSPAITTGRCVAEEQLVYSFPSPGTGSWTFRVRIALHRYRKDWP